MTMSKVASGIAASVVVTVVVAMNHPWTLLGIVLTAVAICAAVLLPTCWFRRFTFESEGVTKKGRRYSSRKSWGFTKPETHTTAESDQDDKRKAS